MKQDKSLFYISLLILSLVLFVVALLFYPFPRSPPAILEEGVIVDFGLSGTKGGDFHTVLFDDGRIQSKGQLSGERIGLLSEGELEQINSAIANEEYSQETRQYFLHLWNIGSLAPMERWTTIQKDGRSIRVVDFDTSLIDKSPLTPREPS